MPSINAKPRCTRRAGLPAAALPRPDCADARPDGEERCVACNLCAAVCPVGCISLQKAEHEDGRWYPEFFRINFSRCIFCGLCEEACPTTAIQLTPDFELGEFKRQDLVYEKKIY